MRCFYCKAIQYKCQELCECPTERQLIAQCVIFPCEAASDGEHDGNYDSTARRVERAGNHRRAESQHVQQVRLAQRGRGGGELVSRLTHRAGHRVKAL